MCSLYYGLVSKSQCQMDYVPVRTRVGNQLYLCSAILAHNLARELQMQAEPLPHRNTTEKRSPRWIFEEIHTLRRTPSARPAPHPIRSSDICRSSARVPMRGRASV